METDGPIKLIRKEGIGHHTHSLEDSTPIVEFILKSVKSNKKVPNQN